MQISNLTATETLNKTDVLVLDNVAGKTRKITFSDLCKQVVNIIASESTSVTTAKQTVADSKALSKLNDDLATKMVVKRLTETAESGMIISPFYGVNGASVSFDIKVGMYSAMIVTFRNSIGIYGIDIWHEGATLIAGQASTTMTVSHTALENLVTMTFSGTEPGFVIY